MRRSTLVLASLWLLLAFTACRPIPASPAPSDSPPAPSPPAGACAVGEPTTYQGRTLNFLSTCGRAIVDAEGRTVLLAGVNWFGMETDTRAPHGLWARNWEEMLDQIVALGYNTIRLPFSSELFDPARRPEGIDERLNPDLAGLTGLEIMDRIIVGAGERGLKVILDRHRITTDGQSKLWYSDEMSEEQWIADWVALARRYRYNDAVIGADLHNEPAGDASWGTGDPKTDWRLAAERAARAIHEVNPDWLIFVEGVEKTEDDFGNVLDWFWMGGALQNARIFPVRLDVPNKLVYSPHDYGPGVYLQSWFLDPEFPENLPKVWDYHWGYLVKEGVAPVLLGEFGGRSVGDDREGQWQRRLVQYLRDNGIHYTYWSFNGNSGDTGGILADDWVSVNQDKQALLSTHQGKLLGNANPTFVDETVAPGPRPSWKPLRVLQQDRNEEEWTTALTPEVHLANKTGEPVGLGDVEVRYWFTPEGQVRPEDLLVKVVGAGFGIVEPKPVDPRQVRVEVGVEPYEIVPRQPLYFVKLTFAPDLQVPQHATLGVRLRVEARDGATLFQENDYSRRKYHWPTAWERIGLYRGGALVWGEDPQSFKERMEAKRASLEDRLSRRR